MARSKKIRRTQIVTWAKRFLVLSVVLGGAAWGASWFFLSDADVKTQRWIQEKTLQVTADMGFVVNNIQIEGVVNTNPEILDAIINIQQGDPLFSLNPQEAKELIERISWIKSARVERRFPDRIYIAIQERVPLAFWQKDEKLRLLDQDGKIIPSEDLSRFKDLMIVVGQEAPKHLPTLDHILQTEPELYERVESASWVGKRRWDLDLKPGITVKLPEQGAEKALHKLSEAQQEEQLLEKKIKIIDLREEGRIVVRTAPGKAMTYKAGSAI